MGWIHRHARLRGKRAVARCAAKMFASSHRIRRAMLRVQIAAACCGSQSLVPRAIRSDLFGFSFSESNVLAKPTAISAIVDRLVTAGAIESNCRSEIVAVMILKRETLGSTGFGHGVAVPHGKHSAVAKVIGRGRRIPSGNRIREPRRQIGPHGLFDHRPVGSAYRRIVAHTGDRFERVAQELVGTRAVLSKKMWRWRISPKRGRGR